ncbi:hypothetical protein ES288_A11G114000v1 [Gossypium darwinii]|uniref:Uncharacterized protein n=2 Tax=Gossypium TaxID=3633 RepID=A0A5D2NA23_GOSTO|nr:hypothetical protein ES288_A11G114000v1 [Gossypium darwinii]TYI00135.1 hypothetical protein ES332_A11G112800v1 [Gossypium tomentosum]
MFGNVFLMAGRLTIVAVKNHPTKEKLYTVLCASTSTGIKRASYSPSSKLKSAKPLSIPNPHLIEKTNYLTEAKISAKETQIQKKTKGLNKKIKIERARQQTKVCQKTDNSCDTLHINFSI